MANIAFPDVPLESITCELSWPGQRVHESVYTGSIQTIPRGIGRWTGTFVWPLVGRIDNAENIRRIDAFFASVQGAVNTFDLPYTAIDASQRDAFPDGTDVRLTAVERTGSTFIATLNQATGLRVGDRVTISNDMFILTTNLAGGKCTLSPYRPLVIPTAGLVVEWRDVTLRARLTQSNPVSVLRNVDWAGPWAAAFQDVL